MSDHEHTTSAAPAAVATAARIVANGARSIWVGDRILLRAHEPADAAAEASWNDSADQRSGWKVWPPRSQAAAVKGLQERGELKPGDAVTPLLAIARREDGLAVGGIGVHSVDSTAGTFMYGLGIGPEHKGNGYAVEAALLILRYMFDERRFQKCGAGVFDYNTASIALHRKLGFVEEGRLRRHVFHAGEYRDEIRFGITAEEYRDYYPMLKSPL